MLSQSDESNAAQRFSTKADAILRQAGWYPGRVVPEEQLIKWMLLNWPTPKGQFQIRMFPAAWRVLREFGNLSLPDKASESAFPHTFVFDPLAVRSYGMWTDFWVIYHEWEADSVLFPLGYLQSPDRPIAIDTRGNIVDGDEYRWLYGRSIEEALENIIVGTGGQPLKIEQWKAEESGWAGFIRQRLGLD